MRTSYQPNLGDKAEGEESGVSGSYISMLLISAYYDMYKAVHDNDTASNNIQSTIDVPAGNLANSSIQGSADASKATLNKSTMDDDIDDEEDDTSPGIKRALMVAMSVTFLLIVATAGVLMWKLLSESSGEATIEALQNRVDKMYTSSNKEELKDSVVAESLESYYDILEKVQAKDKKGKKAGDISKVESELDTIGYYLEDKRKLDTYNSADYDLSSDGLLEGVQTIRDDVSSYSVPGLALTINDLCSKIETDYGYFINLRQEIENITDYINFSSKKYDSKIEEVSHTINKKELQNMVKSLNSAKKKAVAKAKAEEEAKKKEEEKAKKALEEAEEQRKKAQEALEEQERKAEEEARQKEEEIRKLEERQRELEEQQRRLEQQQEDEEEEDEDTPTPTPNEDSGSSRVKTVTSGDNE